MEIYAVRLVSARYAKYKLAKINDNYYWLFIDFTKNEENITIEIENERNPVNPREVKGNCCRVFKESDLRDKNED